MQLLELPELLVVLRYMNIFVGAPVRDVRLCNMLMLPAVRSLSPSLAVAAGIVQYMSHPNKERIKMQGGPGQNMESQSHPYAHSLISWPKYGQVMNVKLPRRYHCITLWAGLGRAGLDRAGQSPLLEGSCTVDVGTTKHPLM